MKTTWHIAEEIWADRPGEKFSDVLKRRDDVKVVEYKHDLVDYSPNRYHISSISDGAKTVYPWMAPNVIHGPIRFVNECIKQIGDGVIVTDYKDNMKVSDYMSMYPIEWFLNRDGYFTTYGMLSKGLINSSIFVRPNSPYKIFTGLEMTLQNFKDEMSSLKQIQNVADNEIVFIASPKRIQSEYRCVIVDKEVVAYSEYRWDNILDIRRDILPECLALAEQVAKYPYQIDDAYVVDVCMHEGSAKIVEFNCFSSSGMYACDLERIIEAINRLSLRIWDENRGL